MGKVACVHCLVSHGRRIPTLFFSAISSSSEDAESFDAWKHTLFFLATYDCILFLLYFSVSVGTVMFPVLYLCNFCEEIANIIDSFFFESMNSHEATMKGTGWLRKCDSFVVHHYSKSFVAAFLADEVTELWLYFRKWRDKNKKAIKQISRCLEGHDYYWLAMFCIVNVPKVCLNSTSVKEKVVMVPKSLFCCCC